MIQHILERGRAADRSRIVNIVRPRLLAYSQHKFASNVVEKCVTHASKSDRVAVVHELCQAGDSQNSALFTMMKDQFANYVVQRLLETTDGGARKLLLSKIKPHLSALRKYQYGKHLLPKLEKYFVKPSASQHAQQSCAGSQSNENSNAAVSPRETETDQPSQL